ncbi:MAG: hypothetical protein ACKOCM_01905 [Cyanobacteriota bacterium]
MSLPVLLLGPLLAFPPARAITLDQACATYAQKLNDAVASGDSQKAQTIYQQVRERIASRFNGATCPNVKAPAGS